MKVLVPACVFVATPLWAADPMGADAFETDTSGWTIIYQREGEPQGIEEYRPDRKVIWRFADGPCRYGEWFEAGGLICFVYEYRPDDVQCWSFEKGQGGLVARFENSETQPPLMEIGRSRAPLMCEGPEVGV